jgi:hypothetical protein
VKLTELKPRWTSPHNFPDGWRTGISFLCPKCRNHRVAVTFDVPVLPDPMSDMERGCWADVLKHYTHNVWKRQGSTFETLTLAPSIDWSGSGCWHGIINQGEVV